MDMASSENSNWIFDYGLMEDIVVPGGEFPGAATSFCWPPPPLINASPDASVEVECSYTDSLKEVRSQKRTVDVDCSSGDSDSLKKVGSQKRLRSESSGASCSKACQEKMRRDRLNERFLELVAVMEPVKLPKTDKAAILSDAARILTQLRKESRQLKETINDLQEKIKELKVEKNELRDERHRLREDKERLEQQVRAMAAQQTNFLSHSPAISSAVTTQGQSPNKLMPFISYPGSVTMWQLMPQTTLNTTQDHILRPPMLDNVQNLCQENEKENDGNHFCFQLTSQ